MAQQEIMKNSKKEEQKVYDFMFISEFRKLDKNILIIKKDITAIPLLINLYI